MDEDADDGQPLVPGHGFPAGGVFKASVDAVVVMSADGNVEDWNPAAEGLFGYPHEEAVGRELAGLIIPEALRERHRLGLARFVETGEATIIGRRLELFALRANGSLVQIELTVTVVPDSDPVLFAGFVRDQSGGEPLERLP